jgi:hypothetical protein
MKAVHALVTLVVGVSFGLVWLRVFWNAPRSVPAAVLAAPAAAAVLGLGHWVAYDFSIGHWAGDFSLMQAIFNFAITSALWARRSRAEPAHA